jgi:hypothetical protein
VSRRLRVMRILFAMLAADGAAVTYTELAGVGHNAWDAIYGNEDVVRWLFAQQRAAR